MFKLKKKWPRNLREQIDTALMREGMTADNDDDPVNKLINAYHGYKNYYEKVVSVAPEIAAAEHFWDRIEPSAPIILDDYGFVSYEEQKRAFNDFARKRGVEILHLPTGQGVILKP